MAIQCRARSGTDLVRSEVRIMDESSRDLPAVGPVADYEQLRRLLTQASLFDRTPAFYAYKIAATLILLGAGIAILVFSRNPAAQFADTILLAVAFTQLSFLVHDAGHGQIFQSSRRNDALGIFIANFVLGMSYVWWNDTHNRHHRFPNHLVRDPDLNVPLISFSTEQAILKQGISRLVAKYQAYIFVPLMFLGAIAKRRGSILFVWRNRYKRRWLEIVGTTLQYAWYFAMIFLTLDWWGGVLFIAMHQGFYGLFMTSVFAPNHKGMPFMAESTESDFLRQQVVTARNAGTNFVFDFWYGGLNYQIEHHLFPKIPRCRLKKAQRLVEPFCESRSIAYRKQPVRETIADVFKYLHSVGRPLRNNVRSMRKHRI